MGTFSISSQSHLALNISSTTLFSSKPKNHLKKTTVALSKKPISCSSSSSSSPSSSIFMSVPLAAASIAIILWSNPAHAGFMSGSTGIESVPGPELPKIDFLNKFNDISIVASAEENQKKYAEFDERFKSSPILKKLLEQSKINKEKNKQAIQDKYCLRGAEWGVGDCSAEGMSPEDKDKFIAMLKEKVGE